MGEKIFDNSPRSCPDSDTLSGWLQGTVEDPGSIERHLENCPTCRETLDALTEPDQLKELQKVVSARSWDFLDPPKRPGDLGTIDDLHIEEMIGQGGAGVVFKAYDPKLDRYVAVKILRSDLIEKGDERFRRESRAAASVSSDYVVGLLGVATTSGERLYLIMELIDGQTLRQRLLSVPPSPQEVALAIRQIALGLQAVHQAGIVHRDLKPANILLDERTQRARLTDFGLARPETGETLTKMNVLSGTPEYISPERASGESSGDPASDIYSLGITMYECLAGTTPFRGQALQILEQHRTLEPVSLHKLNPKIPRDLETICLKAIRKVPDQRYGSAQLMADDLKRYLEGRPILARPVTFVQAVWLWCKRYRALSTAIILLVVSLITGTVFSTLMWLRAESIANDLRSNRYRMRESVSRFQSKVLSDEALHLQMTESFRTEMFNDIIEYLDEFASFEEQATLEERLSLSRDYLNVADAALSAGQNQQALEAARRVIVRTRSDEPENSDESDILRHRSLQIAIRAELNLNSKLGKEATGWAAESLAIANHALEKNADDRAAGLRVFHSRYLVILTGNDTEKESQLDSIYQELKQFWEKEQTSPVDSQIMQLILEISWDIADLKKNSPRDILDTLEFNEIEVFPKLANCWRANNRRLHEHHFLRGNNEQRLGLSYLKRENSEKAKEKLILAYNDFRKALEGNPQNRSWREHYIDCGFYLTDFMIARKEHKLARTYITQSIKDLIRLKQVDTESIELKKRTIRAFVKLAELSEMQGDSYQAAREFYVAAQDCRLLLPTEEQQWGFSTRLWLVSRVVHHLPNIEDNKFVREFHTIEGLFAEHMDPFPDCDMTKFSQILTGEFKPARPQNISQVFE